MGRLELWAGPECTVNRVGDHYLDQMRYSGFERRLEDLDRLAALGITRMRFPIIWERVAPKGPESADWRWTDERLARLRELGVAPIAGLVHHGSGPLHTNLLDPEWPRLLAEYAGAVAQRYPDLPAYTPVNEPLTTARFSGLYGTWYPHERSNVAFVRCLLNEVRGTVLAMRAIRKVNPNAELVQTDDLGYTTAAAPHLQYQADYENERRWLTHDLLCGKVDRHHPMWEWLVRSGGATEAELQVFVDEPCPPDIVGINAYITSERFLDDRLELYPAHLHGGNGRHRYADVETARVLGAHVGGFPARLREAWDRYGLPMAITEVHLGCTREEQMRWLHQTWKAAQKLKDEGLDIRAATIWAAFGTFDWDSLVTQEQGHYEPGLWDVRSGEPRPTALHQVAHDLGHGKEPSHPVLEGPGWWQRELRLLYPHHGALESLAVIGQPVLITGATGTLGRAFARLCDIRGLPYKLLTRQDLDIADPASVAAALDTWKPWAVINTAGYVRVDEAENDPRNWRENVDGPVALAQACAERGVRLLSFSSDLVFDGSKDTPYVETDATRPLCEYGRSKAEAEQRILAASPDSLVVRTAAFFGPWDKHNFVTQALQAMRRGEPWHAAHDQWVSPTYVPDLVKTALDLLVDGERGLVHLANRGAVSWAQLAEMAADAAGLDRGLVQPRAGAELGWKACRPRFSALGSERGIHMPTLEDGLVRYLSEVELVDAG